MVSVPSPEQAKTLKRLEAVIALTTTAKAKAEQGLPERQRAWENEQQDRAEPLESRDWTVRCALDGSLHFQGAVGRDRRRRLARQGSTAWCDGPRGQALPLDGGEHSFVELERSQSRPVRSLLLRRLDPAAGRRCGLSKMNDQHDYRGYDLLIENGRVVVHLVHAWPGDALKVATRKDSLPPRPGPMSSSPAMARARPVA